MSVKTKILLMKLKDFWFEYKRSKSGLIGLGILIFFVSLALAAPIIAPYDPLRDTYLAGAYALPAWAAPPSVPRNMHLESPSYPKPVRIVGDYKEWNVKMLLDYPCKEPPARMVIRITLEYDDEELKSFTSKGYMPWYSIVIVKPNKEEMEVAKAFIETKVVRFDTGLKTGLIEKIFTMPGTYKILVKVGGYGLTFKLVKVTVDIKGKAWGILGTDWQGRDVWSQLVWGTRTALIIGILASVLGVSIGILYGLISGFLGGKVDEVMMRLADVLIAIPKLPLLIALAVILEPNIWLVIVLLGFLGWMGIAKVARSMTLQIKTMQYIEAAYAAGASNARVMIRHILPQLMPYAYANLALSVPDAILVEAGLSFLGLGDPRRITWGKMLHEAQATAALSQGAWWWVIPPGLAIAFLSMSFVLIGHAIDEILNPRLRKL